MTQSILDNISNPFINSSIHALQFDLHKLSIQCHELVAIPEGCLGRAAANQGIDFGPITSCLAIAVEFKDLTKVAIHCIKAPRPDQKNACTLYKELKNSVLEKKKENIQINKIAILGKTEFWEMQDFQMKNIQGICMDISNELINLGELSQRPSLAFGNLCFVESDQFSLVEKEIKKLTKNSEGKIVPIIEKRLVEEHSTFEEGGTIQILPDSTIKVMDEQKIIGKLNTQYEVIKGPPNLLKRLRDEQENLFIQPTIETIDSQRVSVLCVMKKISTTIHYIDTSE